MGQSTWGVEDPNAFDKDNREIRIENKMASYSLSTSSASSSSVSSSSFSYSSSSSVSVKLELDLKQRLCALLFSALRTDKPRVYREFYLPWHISLSGHYYPRYRVTGSSQTGSVHVSYLARPYFCYKVPSRYGFSKFINVRKL